MGIKTGVPLTQTGLIGEDTPVAKALSITTVDEFVSFVRTFPTQSQKLFKHTDLSLVIDDNPPMMAFAVSSAAIAQSRRERVERGTGARAPTSAQRTRRGRLHLEDLSLKPSAPQDKPEVFLTCMSPIRNQGRRGTCVAHAVTAVLECLEQKRTGGSGDLSEQFVYWMAKMNDGSPGTSGTWQRVAVPLIVESGICPEKVWPYNPSKIAGNEGQGPPPDRKKVFDAAIAHKPSRGIILDGSILDNIRARLNAGSAIAISIPVYPNWATPSVDLDGHIPMPIPGVPPDGGHAMCIVGYGFDDDFLGGGYFIVRNSWGTTWAPKSPFGAGHGTLPFSYVSHYSWEAFSLD